MSCSLYGSIYCKYEIFLLIKGQAALRVQHPSAVCEKYNRFRLHIHWKSSKNFLGDYEVYKKNTCGSGSRPTLFFSADPIIFSTRLTVRLYFLHVVAGCSYSVPKWVVPEKIHTPPTEEISAVRRGSKNCL